MALADTDNGLRADPETGEVPVRPFADFLREHLRRAPEEPYGELHDDLSAALHKLTEAVQGVRKKGALTLTITVEPAGRVEHAVTVTGKVALKLPEPDPEEALWFIGRDGNLTRRNPQQPELPGLRTVAPNATPKEVPAS